MRDSRKRVNALIGALSHVLESVDYASTPIDDLTWLRDHDDLPVMQTALAARADTLITDNAADFPLGELRNGVHFMGSSEFLVSLYDRFPDAEDAVRAYLREPDADPTSG